MKNSRAEDCRGGRTFIARGREPKVVSRLWLEAHKQIFCFIERWLLFYKVLPCRFRNCMRSMQVPAKDNKEHAFWKKKGKQKCDCFWEVNAKKRATKTRALLRAKQKLARVQKVIADLKNQNEELSKTKFETRIRGLPPKQQLAVRTCFEAAKRKSIKGLLYTD